MTLYQRRCTSVWYDSDVPVVALLTTTVDFGTIPYGMTTYKPVQFSVEGCRLLRFEIKGISAGDFFIPPGNADVSFPPRDFSDVRTADVFVGCKAPDDGSPVDPGVVEIEAYVVDADGYLTGNPGTRFVIETFTAIVTGYRV